MHVRCARNPHGVHGVSLLQTREEGCAKNHSSFQSLSHLHLVLRRQLKLGSRVVGVGRVGRAGSAGHRLGVGGRSGRSGRKDGHLDVGVLGRGDAAVGAAVRVRLAAPVDVVHLRGALEAGEEGVVGPAAAVEHAAVAVGRLERLDEGREDARQAALERRDRGADQPQRRLDQRQREGPARVPGRVVRLEEDAVELDGSEDAADAGAVRVKNANLLW